ncbi:hypothetical protein ENUP19_0198G0027 [Entamoeba nuttalli]|uniref:Amino acid transporter, putative n=2 Tax=Entamoeba nuttalli TaxID=412467 RepID=K2H295_ENTNP|nr:amino acid transporter, putative [Entamoeba nuttalli P19]EKE40427.1 amino acid transporter, putative [Entamoeba nuttalli P19]|eukprot:XP_008857241.1 amino acid transporter, putative [Entamoeba nuttalli P19]
MSKAVIRSNLDNETLSKTLEKGDFEEYSERFIEDGYHDFPNEEESVDLDVEFIDRKRGESNSKSENEVKRENGEEIAYEPKISTKNESTEQTDEDRVNQVKKLKKAKAKKGFTVEDLIARNFQELLCQKKEFKRNEEGKLKKTPFAWKTLITSSVSLGFNLTNTLVGAGILSLSQACYKMGIVGFVLWSLATIVYFIYTWYYYNRAIYLTGAGTMGELLSLIFGKILACLVDICNTLFNLCILMSYQVIVTQYLFGIIQDLTTRDQWDNTIDECYGNPQRTAGIACGWHYILLILVAVCLNFPFIIPKSVKFLNRISVLSIIVAVFVTFTVMIKAIYCGAKGKSSNGSDGNFPTFKGKWWPSGVMDFFTMAPFITANFQIHSSIPPIYVGTKGMSKKVKLSSLQGAVCIAVLTCSFFFVFMAVSGHVSFDKVSSNVLNDFSNPNSSDKDWLIIVCRMLMIILVLMSYPALTFSTCAGILRYIPKKWKIYQLWNGRVIIFIIRCSILFVTTLCACFVTNIGVIFSVASAIFSIFVVYVCPLSIIMLWPRIEKFGDPNFRKLSVIDNIIYNKVVDGNQKFTQHDIEAALSKAEAQKNEGVADVIVTINNTPTEGQQEIELNEVKEEIQNHSAQNENSNSDFPILPEDDGNEVDIMKNRKKWMKLPDAPVPIWRYFVFGTAMFCCLVLCILSVVGTILGEVNK